MNKQLELKEAYANVTRQTQDFIHAHFSSELGWDSAENRRYWYKLCEKAEQLSKEIELNQGKSDTQCDYPPPIGIPPRYVWDGKRINDILNAMKRYARAEMRIPIKWIDELSDLICSKQEEE